jgi:DNA-binding response OmpR family regulator
MSHKIIIADPDTRTSRILTEAFLAEGYDVDTASDAKTVLLKAAAGAIELLVLEVCLPDENGFSFCRRLRGCGLAMPILMLTAQSDSDVKVSGFRHGADDCLTKPFHIEEMRERVAALLRRSRWSCARPLTERRFGQIYVDFIQGRVSKCGAPVALSGKELRLLHYLMSRSPAVVSRKELLTEVWGYLSGQTRTIDMHVAALRRKLEDNPHHPRHIVTERGRGYRFSD